MIITSTGDALPPFAPAVADAEMLNELIPSTLPKNVGTVACCFTWMPFADGTPDFPDTHVTPVLVKHFNTG
jgi:hypothetical protein